MAAHYWLFPWMSLFVSLIGALGSLFVSRKSAQDEQRPPIDLAAISIWIGATILLCLGALQVGNWGTTDYIPARGVLAGTGAGFLVSLIVRRPSSHSSALTAAVIGTSTAAIAGARLWLTHGEVSGLTSMTLSFAVALICLVIAPSYDQSASRARSLALLALNYAVIITASILIGLARAGTIGDLFWADIPLLIGAAYAVGTFLAASLDRYGVWGRSSVIIVAATAVIVPLALTVAHSLPVMGLILLGLLATVLPLAVLPKARNPGSAALLGHLLIIAGITLAFTLLSGYGIALLALGVVLTEILGSSSSVRVPSAWPSFLALILLYRLEILQNGDSVRSIGLADLWDLLAIGLGILLPRLVAANLPQIGSLERLPKLDLTQWLLSLAIPSLLLDYIWQPRSLTGLFLGLAVGQLAGSSSEEEANSIVQFSSIASGLVLFLFLGGLSSLPAPTRNIRIISVIAIALVIIFRILFSSRIAQKRDQ